MQKDHEVPQQSFKIPYQDCKIHGEKLNYICLDSKCHNKSLSCSICKEELHSKHQARPLKFYLQELHQKYQHSEEKPSNLNSLLEELQINQFTFYQKLRTAVQKVALQFQKLEEEVTEQANKIRNEIFEEMAKRTRFNEFYESLKRGNIDHSNFLIQNYLPQTSVGKISSLESLQTLSSKMCEQICKTKKQLISRSKIDGDQNKSLTQQTSLSEGYQVFDLDKLIRKPENILYKQSTFTQSNINYYGKSLCLIDCPVSNISGKISFKILQIKKPSTIMIGVLPKHVYEAMKECWSDIKLNTETFALGSNGFAYGWQKRSITQFGEGSTLDLSCQSGELKLTQKSKFCSAQIPKGVQLYIVLSLMGECQVKISHRK